MKHTGCAWGMDETFVRISGCWMHLFRAVGSRGQTVDFGVIDIDSRVESVPILLAPETPEMGHPSLALSIQGMIENISRSCRFGPVPFTSGGFIETLAISTNWPAL